MLRYLYCDECRIDDSLVESREGIPHSDHVTQKRVVVVGIEVHEVGGRKVKVKFLEARVGGTGMKRNGELFSLHRFLLALFLTDIITEETFMWMTFTAPEFTYWYSSNPN